MVNSEDTADGIEVSYQGFHEKINSFSYSSILENGVPAVGGLKFTMAQQKVQKSASWGKCQLGEVPVGEVPVGGQGPVGGQNLTLGRTFSIFAGGKNLTRFQP